MLGRIQARAANKRGRAFADQGHDDLAERAYVRAIELDHDYEHAWFNLGLVYKRAPAAICAPASSTPAPGSPPGGTSASPQQRFTMGRPPGWPGRATAWTSLRGTVRSRPPSASHQFACALANRARSSG